MTRGYISYFKGGHPNAMAKKKVYHVKVPMSGEQITQFSKALERDQRSKRGRPLRTHRAVAVRGHRHRLQDGERHCTAASYRNYLKVIQTKKKVLNKYWYG